MTSTATPPTTVATTNGVAEGGRIDHIIDMETDAVMKQRVAKSTRDNYERSKNLWNSYLLWNGEKVTLLWSGIWKDLEVYLKTVSSSARDKNRRGQISWRICYNNMQKKGCFKGDTRRRYAVNTVSIWQFYYELMFRDCLFLPSSFTNCFLSLTLLSIWFCCMLNSHNFEYSHTCFVT